MNDLKQHKTVQSKRSVGCLVACALCLVIPYLMLFGTAAILVFTADNYSGEVTAYVTNVEVREEWDAALETTDQWYHFTSEYTVDGEIYEYSDKRLSRCEIGDAIALRYDPARPERIQTAADHRVMSKPYILLIFLFPPILGAVLILCLQKPKKA